MSPISTLIIVLLLNLVIYCLSLSNRSSTLSCCDEKNHDPNSTTCFFKYNNHMQLKSNQKFVMRTITGGLGNQLFMIFSTLSYTIKYDVPLLFDYNHLATGGDDRQAHWKGLYASLTCFSTLIYPQWQDLSKSLPYYKESAFFYNEIPSPKHLNFGQFYGFKLKGFYQSYKYFDDHKHMIFSAMNISNLQGQVYDLYYVPYFDTTRHIVAMHFRIGDYARFPKKYPIMPLQYYTNAIQQILVDLNTPNIPSTIRLLSVSDPKDSERVTRDYLEPLRIKFPGIELIVVDSAMPDWHQMLLMSLCQVIIIANSTFSW